MTSGESNSLSAPTDRDAAAIVKIRFAQIEPTTRCNYTCGFCAGRHLPQADLDFGVFQRFLDRVQGLEHIELQGEGEPLLHPRFFDMVAYARERFPALGISMVSNGSAFTAQNITRILDHGITRIYVSMESADPARFQAIRGGSLERVRRGVLALLDARRARGLARPVLGIAVTVLRSTVDATFDSIVPFYRECGMDGGIAVQPLQAMPQYVQHYDGVMRGELCRPEDGARFEARLAAAPETRQALADGAATPGFYEQLHASTLGRNVCPWLENGLFLACNGVFTSCCYVKDSARHNLGRVGDPGSAILARRALMAISLAAGRVPPPCAGCGIAQQVAAAGKLRMATAFR